MASDSLLLTTTEDQYNDVTVGTIKCTAPIPFGGQGEWLFLPATKKFDLSRGSEQKMVFDCDEDKRNHTGFMIDPGTSVLIVVDMQNYFIHPIYRDHAAGIAAIEPILKVIERSRSEGIQIAWLNWGITEHDMKTMAPAVQRGFSNTLGWHVGLGAQLPEGQGRCLFKRTWNADLYEPFQAVAQPGDLFFDKTRMSGLWSTEEPLHEYLRASGKQTLLFAGVNTDQCLFGTMSDAYSYGWDCVLLDDCTGTMTGRGAQELTEYQVSTNMGFVTSSRAFCEAQIVRTFNYYTHMEPRMCKLCDQIINDFLPSLTLSVTWPKEHAKLGNTIKPKYLQKQPAISLHDETAHDGLATTPDLRYIVTLTDPDAPSRDNPEWSEMCHWIAANISISQKTFSILPLPEFGLTGHDSAKYGSLDDVVEYKPPGPPPKTGKHRYVFLVFAPKNGTTEPLHLRAPKDRKHWGTGKERGGVRDWAEENQLVPVAANFIYSKNKKQ
ncbi:PEBP-like protein [Cucurbitaria berberidis CBS 394.84]|uniref:PEBP-like protein n=1 Tax=Cucurbitaria berberidis CBS 394.84 TaxID=1168544 RepID=A0A9P4L5W4_9PLEO|nr:PEBP-like protein [Cucurbitaria berberidis CBS 394.84]KAF1842689.1 PEBP-like protein [Cucurbitaria berberidis CBS 394.84]